MHSIDSRFPVPPLVRRPLVRLEKPASSLRTRLAAATVHCRALVRRHPRLSSFATSAIVHATVLVILGLVHLAARPGGATVEIVASMRTGGPTLSGIVRIAPPSAAAEDALSPRSLQPAPADLPIVLSTQGPLAPSNGRAAAQSTAGQGQEVGGGRAAALAGRNPEARAQLAAREGGTPASETAVDRGLSWLAVHQRRDGGWHFNHAEGPCGGLCGNPGNSTSTTGATALALLAFLGAGHTPYAGEHQETVRAGFYYLGSRMRDLGHAGNFQEGTMYAQGISAVALCEAYAMTHDRSIGEKAEAAIDYILFAQDPRGGGWRYAPGEPGDTTVSGWMFMALRCAQMCSMNIPSPTLSKGSRFLDAMGSDGGAFYGYLGPGKEPTPTAIGLLSRMYLGWPRKQPALVRGVQYLSRSGPSESDMYFNYYATQVLHHWGGAEWLYWNNRMRDYLVQAQATSGHEAGSWYFQDKHNSSNKGGRLYNTCLAIMTLEVYYRYLPIYGHQSVDGSGF